MKKLRQASQVLSQFNFRGIDFCMVSIYVQGGGSCLQGHGPEYSCLEQPDIWNWTADRWEKYFADWIRGHKNYNFNEVEVVSIYIAFSLEEEGQMYIIENTDFQNSPAFNRTVIYPEKVFDGLNEVYLMPKESAKIHGVADVVKLTEKLSKTRYVPVDSDLPAVVENEHSRGHFYFERRCPA